jgi:hypothetical protein
MNQDLYNNLRDRGMRNLELPVQNMNLVSAFSDKAKKIKTQAVLTVKFGEVRVNQIFLIAPGLLTQVLIGVDFCVANTVTISFPEKCFTMNVDNEVTKHIFLQGMDNLASSVTSSISSHPSCRDVRLSSVVFLSSTETEGLKDGHAINIPHIGVGSEVSTVQGTLTLASSQVCNVKGNYCTSPP